MMNVAFLGAFTGIGGIQRVTATIASEMAKLYSVFFIEYRKDSNFEYNLHENIQVVDVSTHQNRGILMQERDSIYDKYKTEITAIIDLINSKKIDIVILCGSFCTALLPIIKKSTRSRFIAWQHNSYQKYIGEYSQKYREEYLSGASQADAVVSLTDIESAQFKLLNKNTIRIYNPYMPLPNLSEEKQNENISILFVGRINYAQKGLDFLLKSFDLLNRSEVSLDIVGDGPDMQRLQEAVKTRENIHLHGYLTGSDLAKMYRQATLFICTSLHEGFGLVLLEAMSFGLPIVSTPFGCANEIIGNSGIVTQNFDEMSIANALNLILNDKKLREEMGNVGKSRLNMFNLKQVIEEWIRLLNEMEMIES